MQPVRRRQPVDASENKEDESEQKMDESKDNDDLAQSNDGLSIMDDDLAVAPKRKRKAAQSAPHDRISRNLARGYRAVYHDENSEKRQRATGRSKKTVKSKRSVKAAFLCSALECSPHDLQLRNVSVNSVQPSTLATSALNPNFEIVSVRPCDSDAARGHSIRIAERLPSSLTITRLLFACSDDNFWLPRTFPKRLTNSFPIPFIEMILHHGSPPSRSPLNVRAFSNSYIVSRFPSSVDQLPYSFARLLVPPTSFAQEKRG